jgi:hypothetical protein
MDGKGRVIDNIFIERFWRTLKYVVPGEAWERRNRNYSMKPFSEIQQVTNPARQRLAISRNRVLRGKRSNPYCEAYTGSMQAV